MRALFAFQRIQQDSSEPREGWREVALPDLYALVQAAHSRGKPQSVGIPGVSVALCAWWWQRGQKANQAFKQAEEWKWGESTTQEIS
mmetsp:Transcript_52898/g.123620  ORF Transcript_52898/g.123620 Transcript_52898/m.123620 type:complete len:87 (+) Transcript_52898:357-617(+)